MFLQSVQLLADLLFAKIFPEITSKSHLSSSHIEFLLQAREIKLLAISLGTLVHLDEEEIRSSKLWTYRWLKNKFLPEHGWYVVHHSIVKVTKGKQGTLSNEEQDGEDILKGKIKGVKRNLENEEVMKMLRWFGFSPDPSMNKSSGLLLCYLPLWGGGKNIAPYHSK